MKSDVWGTLVQVHILEKHIIKGLAVQGMQYCVQYSTETAGYHLFALIQLWQSKNELKMKSDVWWTLVQVQHITKGLAVEGMQNCVPYSTEIAGYHLFA